MCLALRDTPADTAPNTGRKPGFWRDFLRVLAVRPRQALSALYWHARGRKVRARNRLRLSLAQSPGDYAAWIAGVERHEETSAQAAATIAGWSLHPLYSIVLYEADIPDEISFAQLLSSLERQCYPHWELVVVPGTAHPGGIAGKAGPAVRITPASADDAAQALAIGVAEARGDFILPLPQWARLPPTALYRYAQALQAEPGADLFYGDHDRIAADGTRAAPWFKPQWNEEMALAQDYVSQACVIRAETVRRALPVADDLAGIAAYALLLALKDGVQPVHVPHVQAHLGPLTPENGGQAARLLAVQRVLNQGAQVRPGPFGTLRTEWPLPPALPLVSIIVPTRDHVKLLRACIESLLAQTDYAPIEVIVVDNDSRDPAALAYLRQLEERASVRVLRYDHPYNYAAINNFAAAQARGAYLCLLNNDTEVTQGDWLTQLMRHAVRPHVGAAGAMLLYGDGSIQHAGVVVGVKQAAGHAHRFLPRDQPGYFRYPHVPHYVSAVTAACLVVERCKFEAVGGLDAQELGIAFNDVDLCLKLQQAGWRNVYVPQAVMVHHESKSRGRDVSARNAERYGRELATLQQRWGTAAYADPLHHPQLDPDREDFVIRSPF